jgi:hypothetical protein
MNSIRIHKVLTKHVKYFQGVCPIGLLPSTFIKPSIIVINLDRYYMPGSNLVAVCFSDSGCTEYFDSYGLPPFKYEIMAYLQRNTISWTFNRHRLQGLSSYVCGHYCCLYTNHRARGLSMTSFVNMFQTARYTCNDKKVMRMFRAQFRKCPACGRLEKEQQSCKSQI